MAFTLELRLERLSPETRGVEFSQPQLEIDRVQGDSVESLSRETRRV